MNINRNRNIIEINDLGPEPEVVNIDRLTNMNTNFRTALWTGEHLQVTLMSINVGEDIGVEMHEDTDQFIRIEKGYGAVQFGRDKNHMGQPQRVNSDYAVLVPAGTWHNITNIGNTPLKLYSIYAPPKHPFGTVHQTKADAEAAHE